jgi:hypothetical protein
MYERILLPNLTKSKWFSLKLGAALGLQEAIKFSVMGGFFWIGAEILVFYGADISVENVMGAIFLLLFSVVNAA